MWDINIQLSNRLQVYDDNHTVYTFQGTALYPDA